MANQQYAKLKLKLWAQGYEAGLRGQPDWPTADYPWREGYAKGVEIKAELDAKGISLK